MITKANVVDLTRVIFYLIHFWGGGVFKQNYKSELVLAVKPPRIQLLELELELEVDLDLEVAASWSIALQAAAWPAQSKLWRNMQEVIICHVPRVWTKGLDEDGEKMSAGAKQLVKVSASRKRAWPTASKAGNMSTPNNWVGAAPSWTSFRRSWPRQVPRSMRRGLDLSGAEMRRVRTSL